MKYARQDIAEIADEYVLGLLEPGEQADVEAEMESDADLRAAVATSRERFLPLDAGPEPAGIDRALWERIEAALPAQGGTVDQKPVPAQPSNDNRQTAWRHAALSAIAASLLLAVGLGITLTRSVEPLVIAVLLNDKGEVQAVVEDFGNENASVRLLADYQVPSDKTIQVWTLPSRDMGPMSLGLLEGARSASLKAPELPQPKDAQLYELTLEQAGGSPTGRPTGPILAKGFAKLTR
jgi:anti-sigma-K factor RskA